MRKLALNLDDLTVESFSTAPHASEDRGERTVRGYDSNTNEIDCEEMSMQACIVPPTEPPYNECGNDSENACGGETILEQSCLSCIGC